MKLCVIANEYKQICGTQRVEMVQHKRDLGGGLVDPNQQSSGSEGVFTSMEGGEPVVARPINYLVLGLAVAAVAIGTTALLVGIFCLVKRFRSKKKSITDYDFEDNQTFTSKSEPSTRSSSPSSKRKSLSNQGRLTNKKGAILMKSLTVEMIPDFELPPERVQPGERQGSMTALQFQHSLISSLSTDMPGATAAGDSDEAETLPSMSGRLWFSLVYDAAVEELTVNLIKAKQLKPREKTNIPRDPFVKLYLLPDERACQESRVRKKTLSPKYNETFTFKLPCEDIASRTLRLSVYDVDKRRVRHSLGHILIPLADTDLTTGEIMWRDLEQLSQNSGSLGEINLSLSYAPVTEKLKVVVLRASNLRKLDFDKETGVYVRVQLTHGQKVHKMKRTDTHRGTCEPVYNESFTFTVPGKQIDACSVVVTLMVTSAGRLGSHEEEYGKVTVGPFMYARGEELMHWQEMMAQPRIAVARWHQFSHIHKKPGQV